MAHNQTEIVISSAVRTPIGCFSGVFSAIPAIKLGATAIWEVIIRAGVSTDKIDSVLMGDVIQAGNKINSARQTAIDDRFTIHPPTMTLNRVCGSGLQAVISANQEIIASTAEAVIAGGMENMDRAPFLNVDGRYGHKPGHVTVYDAIRHDGLADAFLDQPFGWVTEDLVTKYEISSGQQDAWALRRQPRFAKAQAAGLFDKKMVGVEVSDKKGKLFLTKNTSNRPDNTIEALTKLKSAFRSDGSITAGNAPSINAGAAAMLASSRVC